jgi:hypothetical protein
VFVSLDPHPGPPPPPLGTAAGTFSGSPVMDVVRPKDFEALAQLRPVIPAAVRVCCLPPALAATWGVVGMFNLFVGG